MQSPNGNGSDVERRLSVRSSTTTRDDTDDEYDPTAGAIADGFRPPIADSTSNHAASSSFSQSHTAAPTSSMPPTSAPSSAQPQMPNRPSSVAKPPRAVDHLALRHDGPFVHQNVSRLSRASSGAGSVDSPVIRSVSPYQGPSGPSHPYQMYPQRTMSVATSTTAPVSERSYQGPQRPTHPYGLYTQSTETSDSSDVTVGFGRPDNYQRRIGPDGEEAADLIGPLGHTEELPPYTRYPDVAYIAKTTEVAAHVADPIDGPSTSRTTPAIPGAGGIGLATRNPEYESRDDLPLPPSQSRLSTRSVTSEVVSQHEINTAAVAYNEKQQGPRWQTRAKKRMWGIVPYWAVCLVAVALLIMGIVLGAVIGTLLAKGDGKKNKPDEDPFPATGGTTTTTSDVIPLATPPPDLPPLVEGTFSLPPLIESQAPTTCFNDTSQAQAWTCNVPFEIYSMTLAALQDASPVADYVLQLYLSNNSSPSDLYTWGTQPPIIEDPIQMRLVKDTAELELGPAWFGHFVYNKTVIIAEDRFPNVGSSKRRRGFVLDDPTSGFRRAGVIGAQVGDRPWICEWPGTMLEIFIYPYQTNSLSRNQGPNTGGSATTPSVATSSAVPPPDNQAFTETVSVAPPVATSRAPKIAAPPYPNIIKIEESRLSDDDSRAAVCQQVEICEDGISSKPVYDASGQPIKVNIIENQRLVAYRFEPPSSLPVDGPTVGVLPRQEDGKYTHLSECGCMWWFR